DHGFFPSHEVVHRQVLAERRLDAVERPLLDAGDVEDRLTQRLARDGGAVETVAAEPSRAFDHGDALAELGGLHRGLLARRPGADDGDVEIRGHGSRGVSALRPQRLRRRALPARGRIREGRAMPTIPFGIQTPQEGATYDLAERPFLPGRAAADGAAAGGVWSAPRSVSSNASWSTFPWASRTSSASSGAWRTSVAPVSSPNECSPPFADACPPSPSIFGRSPDSLGHSQRYQPARNPAQRLQRRPGVHNHARISQTSRAGRGAGRSTEADPATAPRSGRSPRAHRGGSGGARGGPRTGAARGPRGKRRPRRRALPVRPAAGGPSARRRTGPFRRGVPTAADGPPRRPHHLGHAAPRPDERPRVSDRERRPQSVR